MKAFIYFFHHLFMVSIFEESNAVDMSELWRGNYSIRTRWRAANCGNAPTASRDQPPASWRGTVFESSDTGNKSIHWSNSSRGATVQPTTVHLDAPNQLDLDSGRAALAQRTIDSLNDTHKLKALGEPWCDQRTPRRPQLTKKGSSMAKMQLWWKTQDRLQPWWTIMDQQLHGGKFRGLEHDADNMKRRQEKQRKIDCMCEMVCEPPATAALISKRPDLEETFTPLAGTWQDVEQDVLRMIVAHIARIRAT